MVTGRRIVLGVTGGIAAYKAIEVCRRLVDAGAHVVPVLTDGAQQFVGAVTFTALASEPAKTSLFTDADPIPHTRLGQQADLIVVAPATARLIGAYAAGISDDLLTATLLATAAPVVVCPAMHTEMWEHPAVQHNLAVLRERGVVVVPPDEGRLAGGDHGAGRLADPEVIVDAITDVLAGGPGPAAAGPLAGTKVLVTAGGTRESIDPVRVITNRSSGKQGYALAAEAVARGAQVTLVTTVDRPAPPGAEIVQVASAADMEAAVMPRSAEQDVIIMAAAVADFRPRSAADHKIKKGEHLSEILLEPTHDFLVDLGRQKPPGQVLVGFAAETDDLLANAKRKLEQKCLDLIVANDVAAPGAGFEHDTNAVVIVARSGWQTDIPLRAKHDVARAVLDAVARVRAETQPEQEHT